MFEVEAFRKGSVRILEDLIQATQRGAITVAGGGDTVALVNSVAGAEKKTQSRQYWWRCFS